MFSKWEKNTLKYWQLLEQAEECLQHNDLENYLHCFMLGEVMTLDLRVSSYNSFSTDHCEVVTWHSNTFSLIMPHYDAGMTDEGMGSRWTSKSPHRYHGQNAIRSKFLSLKIRIFEEIVSPFQTFSSLGIIWTLIITSVYYSSFPKV